MRYSQEACFLSTLLQQIQRGMLLPAVFLRPYVWTKAEVLSFMESLAKGYPVGNITTWTATPPGAAKSATRSRLGPIQANSAGEPLSMLFDGQNRLATLAWAMRVPGSALPDDLTEHEKSVWADGTILVVDPRTLEFKFVPEAEAMAPTSPTFPMYAVTSYTRANEYSRTLFASLGDSVPTTEVEATFNALDKLQYAIMNARVGTTVMFEGSAAEARDVYLRACKAGVPMTDEDFSLISSWVPPAG